MATTMTEAVKKTFVGTTIEPELSQEVRATFDRHSIQDEATGERYMTEKEFVDAIAPVHEDYVSFHKRPPASVEKYPTASLGNIKLTGFRS